MITEICLSLAITALKSSLEQNKIYLDWLSGVVTSAGAALVGYFALRLSRQANRLSENQNEIMKQQLDLLEAPLKAIIRFVLDTENDSDGDAVERLQIYNDGAAITAPFLYKRDFIVVSYKTPDTGEEINLLIPCFYFSLHKFTDESRGLVVTLEAYSGDAIYLGRQGKYNQTAALKRFSEAVVAKLSAEGVLHPQVRMRKIIHFGYTDQRGKRCDDYYEMKEGRLYNDPSPARRIPDEHVDRLVREGMLRMSVTQLRAEDIFLPDRLAFYKRQYVERNIPG